MSAMRFVVLAAAAALGAAPAQAQVVTVDEGSFTVSRQGAVVGREEFRIVRRPSAAGPVYVASASAAFDERRMAPALETDAAGVPRGYELEVRAGGDVEQKLRGMISRGRLSTVSRTPRGESAREYILAEGALILDDDIFHQYYFMHERTGAVPVVIPRRNVQLTVRVENTGSEHVTVGGQALPATHLVVSEPGGARRDVWLDAEGRVLKVEIPARGVLALRDDPPR